MSISTNTTTTAIRTSTSIESWFAVGGPPVLRERWEAERSRDDVPYEAWPIAGLSSGMDAATRGARGVRSASRAHGFTCTGVQWGKVIQLALIVPPQVL